MNLVLLFNLGGQEILIIAILILLLFGGKKIPELMRGLGKGIREFNDAKSNIQSEIKNEMKELEKPNLEELDKTKIKNEEVVK
ncbi:MAG: twin-arginine translocase TatA/TatE family subunit [Saprospiraceae bacterium]